MASVSLDDIKEQVLTTLEDSLGEDLLEDKDRLRKILVNAVDEFVYNKNPNFIKAIKNAKRIPVTIREFMTNPDYIGETAYWDQVYKDLEKMCPDVWVGEVQPTEVILTGACHAKGTKILKYDGSWCDVENIVEGDVLMGDDSTARNVLSLARGRQLMYKVIPNKGVPFTVNQDHILSLKRTGKTNPKTDNKRGEIVNVRVKDYLLWSKTRKHLYKLYRPNSVSFNQDIHLSIDPYVLGLLLGDGCFRGQGAPTLTTGDSIIVDRIVNSFGSDVSVDLKSNHYSIRFLSNSRIKANLKELSLWGTSSVNKFIPAHYLRASQEDRLKLLAGLIDSDGHLNKSKTYTITTKSERLAEDIKDLSQSLGMAATITDRKVIYKDQERVYRGININNNSVSIPCILERKQYSGNSCKNPLMTGFSLEKLEVGEYYGFEVDGNNLYIMEDYFVSHNTGIAKSYRTNIALCYTLYCLTCFEDPHYVLQLKKDKPIVLGCTAARMKTARDNVYRSVRKMFLNMPYIKKYGIAYNKDKESELELTDINVIFQVFRPDFEHILGADLIAFSVEEANTMQITEKSKKVVNEGGDGTYDQAERIIYEALSRRDGRYGFLSKGPSKGFTTGGVYVVSSANHDNDYVSKRLKKIHSEPDQDLKLVFKQRRWDVIPEHKYSKVTFPVLVGTKEYSGKILTHYEAEKHLYAKGGRVEWVPDNWRYLFEMNFEKNQRDIIGEASTCIDVYIKKPEKIIECMEMFYDCGFKQWTDKLNYDIGVDGMPRIIEENLPNDLHKKRIMHIDIATNDDRCGIAIAKIHGKTADTIGEDAEGDLIVHNNIVYVVECLISLIPSKGREIDIEEVRDWAVALKRRYGMNIDIFSFDRHQSKESRQKIKKLGFKSKMFSCKDKPESYDYFKSLIYSNRVMFPRNEDFREELLHLQKDERTGKVDHAPGYNNDMTDAVVSAIYQFQMQRTYKSEIDVIETPSQRVIRNPRRRNPRRRR